MPYPIHPISHPFITPYPVYPISQAPFQPPTAPSQCTPSHPFLEAPHPTSLLPPVYTCSALPNACSTPSPCMTSTKCTLSHHHPPFIYPLLSPSHSFSPPHSTLPTQCTPSHTFPPLLAPLPTPYKEKLCLLVMSMPASELLTIAMQQAVQFVLDHILWASHNSFSQWLHHRKIPLITQTVATIH